MLPTINISSVEALEGGYVIFTVTLSEVAQGPVTVQFRTVQDGSALEGVDYDRASGTLTIPQGQTVAQIFIRAVSDSANDADENFTLELSDPVNAVLAGGEPTLTATGVVLDDDGGPDRALFVSDPTIVEGTGGSKQAVFEVRLSEAFSSATTLNFVTADGTAVAGQDYVARTGTINFQPGQTIASVAVDLIEDGIVETNETFSLVVTPVASIANGVEDSAGIATILDDDPDQAGLPVISISSAEALEREYVIFTVTLSEVAQGPVTVQFRTV
ncbi:Calx-beta domain-containing protein, partial [Roseibium sp. FZY0029]|uniref:Calx-beta domain-containing protein n=1 Tax=Roseibium sp. FZY0029 TaxID=3116647 RepID=UPI002EBEB353|nr:Calx-beta domain-containing protein [Roseibium sp. FZY0029]